MEKNYHNRLVETSQGQYPDHSKKIIEQGKLFEDITRLKLKDKFKDDICNKLDCLPVEFDRVMANEHVMKFLKK